MGAAREDPYAPVRSWAGARPFGPAGAAVRWLKLSGAAALDVVTGRAPRTLRSFRVQVLNLHHLFSDEEEGFRRLLGWFARWGHRFVGYSEAVERIAEGPVDAPLVTFTFDDGLRSCLRAARVLSDLGAGACFFLNSASLDGWGPEEWPAFCRERLGLPPVELLTWDEAEELKRLGHEVGGHGRRHLPLRRLEGPELTREVAEDRRLLEERLGPVRHFSWAQGRADTFSAEALRAVREAGYESCASGVRGCHVRPDPEARWWILRDHAFAVEPPGHTAHFLIRSARHPDGWRRVRDRVVGGGAPRG